MKRVYEWYWFALAIFLAALALIAVVGRILLDMLR